MHKSKFFTILEKIEIGLIEKITFFFKDGKKIPQLTDVPSKVDTGNDGYNVLNAEVLESNDEFVKFKTIGNIVLKKPHIEDIIIHVGSGNKEIRPVVLFNIEIGDKIYKNIPFSLADRSDNEYPILISKDFISDINGVVNVNKVNELK